MADGDSESIVARYMKKASNDSNQQVWERTGNGHVKFTSVEILDSNGNTCPRLPMGHDLRNRASGIGERSGSGFNFAVQFVTSTGIIAIWVYDQSKTFHVNSMGEFSVEMIIPRLMLMPGSYVLSAWLGRAGQESFDWVKNAGFIEVVQSDRIPFTDTIDSHFGIVYAPSETKQIR